jgi:hypothetical protein
MSTVFLPWIYENIDKLDMTIISKHLEAVPYFKDNPNKIDWDSFSENPAAINIIEDNLNKVNWSSLSRNSSAFNLLYQNKNKIDWNELGHNIAINTHLLYEGNIDKIKNWMPICKNRSVWIVNILDGNIDKISKDEMYELSLNPSAIPIIEKYLHQINKYGLIKNEYVQQGIYGNIYPTAYSIFKYLNYKVMSNYCESPVFVSYLKQNRNKINRDIYLNTNPYAEELIEWFFKNEECLEKIDYENEPYWWPHLSANPVAVRILENYIEYICWEKFSKLENAIYIIQNNLDKVNWNSLSLNCNALNILKLNQNKINWKNLSQNNGIYVDQTRFTKNKETEKNKYTVMQQEQDIATNLLIINFDELTINYDEEYIDETLKPLYEEIDTDTDY